MNQQESNSQHDESLTEHEVADYLRAHPAFFERHQPLLLRLKLPHETGAATISLVERQVAMLRQRNGELEHQLKELVVVAKANNTLVDNIHSLAIKLLRSTSTEELIDQLELSLREDFGAERAVLILFEEEARPDFTGRNFVKYFARTDDALKPFVTFLKSGRPRCGSLRDRQKELLFDREADSVVSAAMVPLGTGPIHGFLTIGSKDANFFHPGQRVDFLARLGELVAVALEIEHDNHRRD
jgi:uncharacterized protein YigA (DUF484 family)